MRSVTAESILEEKIPHGTPQLPFSAHYSQVTAGTSNILYKHWHQEFEFLIITHGGAKFFIDDAVYELHAQEGVFIPPNALHYATSLNGLPCSFFAYVFHPSFLSDNYKSSLYLTFVKPVLSGKVIFTPHFGKTKEWETRGYDLLLSLSFCYQQPLEPIEMQIKGRLYELWALFLENAAASKVSGKMHHEHAGSDLTSALDYIHEHFEEDITLQNMSACASLSQSQFCRTFKSNMGLSPFSYLIRYRILRSCAMITDTNEKIAVIASRFGFNNVSYFNRSFRSVIGCTPIEYRRNKETYIT